MRKSFIKLSIVVLCLQVFSACLKDITLKVDSKNNKQLLVLNSLLQTDSFATVQVSLSGSIFNNTNPEIVSDADVELWENGNLISKMTFANGMYSCAYKPKAGGTYTIKAAKLNYDKVEGSTTIPYAASISVIGIDSVNRSLTVKINDPAATTDYYGINMYGTDSTHQFLFDPLFLQTKESALLNNATQNGNGGGDDPNRRDPLPAIISDQYFNGTNNAYTIYFSDNSGNSIFTKSFVLKTQSFSSEIYKYKKSQDDYHENNGNPFAEPTLVYTNVKNGLGVVGSTTYSKLIILR